MNVEQMRVRLRELGFDVADGRIVPNVGCAYPASERCGVRCWDIPDCAYLVAIWNERLAELGFE